MASCATQLPPSLFFIWNGDGRSRSNARGARIPIAPVAPQRLGSSLLIQQPTATQVTDPRERPNFSQRVASLATRIPPALGLVPHATLERLPGRVLLVDAKDAEFDSFCEKFKGVKEEEEGQAEKRWRVRFRAAVVVYSWGQRKGGGGGTWVRVHDGDGQLVHISRLF